MDKPTEDKYLLTSKEIKRLINPESYDGVEKEFYVVCQAQIAKVLRLQTIPDEKLREEVAKYIARKRRLLPDWGIMLTYATHPSESYFQDVKECREEAKEFLDLITPLLATQQAEAVKVAVKVEAERIKSMLYVYGVGEGCRGVFNTNYDCTKCELNKQCKYWQLRKVGEV